MHSTPTWLKVRYLLLVGLIGGVVCLTASRINAQLIFTDDDYRHLLTRTTFAVSPDHLEFIQNKGVDKYLDMILGKEGKKKAPKAKKKASKKKK